MSNQVTAVMRDSLDQRSVTSSSPHTSVCQTVFSGTVVKVEKPGEKKPLGLILKRVIKVKLRETERV